MKNVTVTMGLAVWLLASGAWAGDITLTPVTTATVGNGYLPKVASDGQNSVVSIAATGGDLSALEFQTGAYVGVPLSLTWTGPYGSIDNPSTQIGLSPSIALAFDAGYSNYDDAVEVHQGGQKNDSSLWIQLGNSGAQVSIGTAPNLNWSGATLYDTGYNATVAADTGASTGTATVVEVHQSGIDLSTLWYHVGTLTLGPTPSLSTGFGTPHEMMWDIKGRITPYQGTAPTVSVCNNFVVVVAQGADGALWYAIGQVIHPGTASVSINWLTLPVSYGTTGYNPGVSIYSNGGPRVVVEAHQANPGPSQLSYRTGRVTYSTTTGWSITWAPDADTPFPGDSTDCYPSVALSFGYTGTGSNTTLTETHEAACGSAPSVQSSFSFVNF